MFSKGDAIGRSYFSLLHEDRLKNVYAYLSYEMKTMFHNSTTELSLLTSRLASGRFGPIRSKWISVEGPQGPTEPISQKFSDLNGMMRSSGNLQAIDFLCSNQTPQNSTHRKITFAHVRQNSYPILFQMSLVSLSGGIPNSCDPA